MVLSLIKIMLILLVLINVVLISVFTMLGRTKIAVALAVLGAFLIASAGYFG